MTSGRHRRIAAGLVCLAAILFGVPRVTAQSLTGMTGLITIPTAEMQPDGSVLVGAGRVHREAVTVPDADHHVAPFYAAITFLPMVELGFRFSPQIGVDRDALGDRTLMARVQVLPERGRWPAVALGAHDFLKSSGSETRRYNALYVVASKHVAPLGVPAAVHGGYGTDVIDAKGHQFVGFFGGVSIAPHPVAEVMAEYDGTQVLVGGRITVRGIYLVGGLASFRYGLGGMGLRWRL